MTESTSPVHTLCAPLDPSLLQQVCIDKSWGPLKVEACVDISQLQVSINVSLYGTRIGGCTINSSHPSCSVGGSVGVASAKVEITLDTSTKELTYNIQLCVLGSCKNLSGVLYSWNLSEI
ncbi:MAG: hypothetical protein K0U98_11705 [Deltaproteobacteria bacterium]|nr:hypothetical protein [Deltaproteobacteria bacterium]